MPIKSSQRAHAALLAVLVAAFALRVYDLDAQSLWYDEAVTAQVVQQGLAELARWTADDIQPPLYYAITAGWVRLAGASEWALRFPSAWFGVLAAALAFALAQRLFGAPAGLMAALLAAVHPLWLYYSQEARMYTLLTALGMAAGYAVLRLTAVGVTAQVAGRPRPSALERPGGTASPAQRRSWPGAVGGERFWWWCLFTAAAIALLYTHYFALFLLVGLALFFVLALAVGRPPAWRRLLAEGVVVAAVILLAYLPWLPNAVRRFSQDASYWRGTLKLDEALRHLAISFTTGETALEAQATPLAWIAMALAAVGAAALLWSALRPRTGATTRNGGRAAALSVWFAVLYLVAPAAAILALAYRTPKFNPRYLMMASPGLILLYAGALALPFRPRPAGAGRGAAALLPRLVSAGVLLSLLAVYFYADRNWFADAAFTKDDWRGAAAFVRAHLQPDEAVVLVSGHAYPAWRYYAPDIEPVRLPSIETLDVNAVLGLDAAHQLNEALAGSRGAWLLRWQDEVVDPNGVVPFLLDTAGDPQSATASFWGLGPVEHFRFVDAVRTNSDGPGVAFPAEPPLTAENRGQLLNTNFGNQVELVAAAQPPCPQPLCPVYLFWRALKPLSTDLKLSATLLGDEQDSVWSQPEDRRLAAYDYPTFRWQPGEVVLNRLDLAPERGTPPGEYRLRLGVYDDGTGQALDVVDAAGAAQGRWSWLEPVVATALVAEGPGGPAEPGQGVAAAPEIALQSLSVSPVEVEPGDPVRVEVWWQATAQPSKDYRVSWQWVAPDGQPRPDEGAAPPAATFPTSQWSAGDLVRSQLVLSTPAAAQPGPWRLRVGLQAVDAAAAQGFAGATAEAPLTVLPSTRRFEPSAAFDYPLEIDFGAVAQLLGVRSPALGEAVKTGSVVPVTVGWRGLGLTEVSYTGFVHLLDDAGRVVAQDDHIPLQGRRPTTTWAAGEVIEDTYTLSLPADLAGGRYRLEIGLYDAGATGLPRLRTTDGADSVIGPEITVAPAAAP